MQDRVRVVAAKIVGAPIFDFRQCNNVLVERVPRTVEKVRDSTLGESSSQESGESCGTLNRTINAMIRSYVRSDQRLWDTKVSEMEYVLNNTVHSSTKFSPHRIVFGNEIMTRGSDHRLESNEELTDEVRMEKMRGVSKKVWEMVVENLKRTHESTKRQYDLRHKRYSPTFDVGQRVYKRSFRQSSAGHDYNAKLGPVYSPCIIVAKKGTSSYELSDMNGKSLGVFSSADLKA